MVFGIVNGQGRHSPDCGVRFVVATGESDRANGNSIACNPGLDGFSACRSMPHRSRFVAAPDGAARIRDSKCACSQGDRQLKRHHFDFPDRMTSFSWHSQTEHRHTFDKPGRDRGLASRRRPFKRLRRACHELQKINKYQTVRPLRGRKSEKSDHRAS